MTLNIEHEVRERACREIPEHLRTIEAFEQARPRLAMEAREHLFKWYASKARGGEEDEEARRENLRVCATLRDLETAALDARRELREEWGGSFVPNSSAVDFQIRKQLAARSVGTERAMANGVETR